MGWNNAVITNSGLSLIAQAVSGGTLTITSAGLGGGTVDTTALMAQTALTTPLTVPAVISAKGTLDNGLTVRVQIRNTGVTAAQRMKQVGLFAKLSDNDPVLFAIMQDDTGEEIPPAAEYPDFMIEFTAAVAVSNTDNIVVTISSSAVITRGALDEELKNYTKADQFNELSSTVSELSETKADKASVEEALNGKADTGHTHTVNNISDFPTSLPANGGNADTLDGLHANEIASNPNLLINYDFKINQRGASGTKTEPGYFVDQWKLVSGSVTINSDGTLTLDGTISQILEKAVGTDVTATANAGTASYDDSTKTYTLTASGEVVSWAKLEIGSVATLFSPPDPATELAKCKRFYQRLRKVNAIFGSGFIGSTTRVYSVIPIVAMRARPTLILTGNVYVWATGHIGANAYPSAAAALDDYVVGGSVLAAEFTISADATSVGQGCTLQFRDADSYIELSAEL